MLIYIQGVVFTWMLRDLYFVNEGGNGDALDCCFVQISFGKCLNFAFLSLDEYVVVFQICDLYVTLPCLVQSYEFWLSLCKIVRSSVILLLPIFAEESIIFFVCFQDTYSTKWVIRANVAQSNSLRCFKDGEVYWQRCSNVSWSI
jgi:hypothetical protein